MESVPGAEPEGAEREDGASRGDRLRYERDELLASSRALSSERDTSRLLDLILAKSRQITGADAGSVYVLEAPDDDGDGLPDRGKSKILHFMLAQNDSLPVDFKQVKLRVDEGSIVGKAVLDARPINVPDLARLGEPGQNPWGFRHNRSFDEQIGYQARSMLTVPMLSARDEVIGVIQLINRKRRPGRPLRTPVDFETEVVPFDGRAEELALALASQAGICLENAVLYKEITSLFEGFVDAAVQAIEARDPTTSGHSRRVATLTVALAEKVDAIDVGPLRDVRFSREDLRQIEYAGVLHDFGKVGVRESVLVKAHKLHDWQREAIQMRLRFIRKAIEAETLERKLALVIAKGPAGAAVEIAAIDRALGSEVALLEEAARLFLVANEPSLLGAPVIARLREIGGRSYVDSAGHAWPYLEPGELEALEVARGSLTPAERKEIQSHVTHTVAFLDTIPWGRSLRSIPRIAGGHHELLDGSGYPRGLRSAEIPIETRMLTIADIFDALTAADRPYKAAVPVPSALGILEGDVQAGRCDALLFRVFVEGEVFRRVLPG